MENSFNFKPFRFNWVALHPRPVGTVYFIGDAIFGSLPTFSYHNLLKNIFEQGYTVVVIPCGFTSDYWSFAINLLKEQKQLREEIILEAKRKNYDHEIYIKESIAERVKYFWIGHGSGCRYILLLELLTEIKQKGNFNLYSTLSTKDRDKIERQLNTIDINNSFSIENEASILLQPKFAEYESSSMLRSVSILLENTTLNKTPTAEQIFSLIQESNLFNLTSILSFEKDATAIFYVHSLQQILEEKLIINKNISLNQSDIYSQLRNEYLDVSREVINLLNFLRSELIIDFKYSEKTKRTQQNRKMTENIFWYVEEGKFGNYIDKAPEDRESWEPRNKNEWIERDRLTQTLIKYELISTNDAENSASAVFDSWVRLAAPIRKQIWREREIAARLHHLSLSKAWEIKIPGFISVGVGKKKSGNFQKLVGIINIDSRYLPPSDFIYDFYNKHEIPEFIKVFSSIESSDDLYRAEVALFIEGVAESNDYCGNSINTNASVACSTSSLTVQSGDAIHCEDIQISKSTKPGTLTTIVFPKNVSIPQQNLRLLTVSHILNKFHPIVFTEEINPHTQVGQLHQYKLNLTKSNAQKLDAAVANLNQSCGVNPQVRWANIIPAPPIMPYADMPVQMYGSQSGHQLGYITQTNLGCFGGTPKGLIPTFRANINSQPGDSGSLLVSGHKLNHIYPPSIASDWNSDDLNRTVCAMLGMLKAGPLDRDTTTSNNDTYFIPLSEIFLWLKIVPIVRRP